MACKIELTNYTESFLAGNMLEGNVVCTFENSNNIQGISIILKGKESAFWEDTENGYHADNKFLLDTKSLAPRGLMRPGIVKLPFTFTLPKNIPSSYKGGNGSIKYTLKAKVDRPLRWNYADEVELKIKAPIDLNQIVDKSLLYPDILEEKKTVYYCCIPGGKISMQVNLEKKAFVPPETVKIGVKIWNNTSLPITYVKAKLCMSVTARIKGTCVDVSDSQSKSVAKVKEKCYGFHKEKEYELYLPLESVEVPNFADCKLLNVKHQLFVIAGIPGCHWNLVVGTDLCLADIPLRTSEFQVPHMTKTRDSSAPLVFGRTAW